MLGWQVFKRIRQRIRKRMAYTFILGAVLFAYVPIIIYALQELIVAQIGMSKTWDIVEKEEMNVFIDDLLNVLHKEGHIITEKLDDVRSSLDLIAIDAKKILSQPGRYAELFEIERDSLLSLDPGSGVVFTPKKAALSIRLTKKVELTEALNTKIIALMLLKDKFKATYEDLSDILASVRVFTKDGIDIVYPWKDYKRAAYPGIMEPAFHTFKDMEVAKELFQPKTSRCFYSPISEDWWGAGKIISQITPIRDDQGEIIAFLGADLIVGNLLKDARKTFRRVPYKLVLVSNTGIIVDASVPVSKKDLHILNEFIFKDQDAFGKKVHGNLEFMHHLIYWDNHEETSLVLVSLIDKIDLYGLLSPLKKRVGQAMNMFIIPSLVTFLLLAVIIAFFSRRLNNNFRLTLNRFTGTLEAIEEGDKRARLVYKGFEELELFAGALNHTMDTVAKHQDALEGTTKELKNKLKTIETQKETILGLSIPIVPVLRQTLLVPIIGILDPYRVQQVADKLLKEVQNKRIRYVIFDMTGCPEIDTHGIKAIIDTITAVRFLGVQCYMTGLSPKLVKSITRLGIEPYGVETVMSLDVAVGSVQKKLDRSH